MRNSSCVALFALLVLGAGVVGCSESDGAAFSYGPALAVLNEPSGPFTATFTSTGANYSVTERVEYIDSRHWSRTVVGEQGNTAAVGDTERLDGTTLTTTTSGITDEQSISATYDTQPHLIFSLYDLDSKFELEDLEPAATATGGLVLHAYDHDRFEFDANGNPVSYTSLDSEDETLVEMHVVELTRQT